MAKKIVNTVKLQIPAGNATPAPPVGPALGQAGINIGEFVNQFNDQTRDRMGDIVPVVINVYDDRSFDFVCKVSPMSRLILKKINPNVRVLLSSGYSIDGQASQIMERGCDGFIQKPFTMSQLSEAIRKILDH